MTEHRSSFLWFDFALQGGSLRGVSRGSVLQGLAASVLALALAGCGGGNSGSSNSVSAVAPVTLPTTSVSGAAALTAASTLNMSITGVGINSPPAVSFVVTNESGVGMAGLTSTDLRFNIAKLIPGSNGGPSQWQNYINRAVGGAVQGSQERSATGYVYGKLVDYGNGSYGYNFATDITSGNVCPAPCTDASGKQLDISYEPGALHRVAIQQANSAYPRASATFDFVPNGGAGVKRDIVANATCDQCHNQLTNHGTRVEAKLCLTCHNPGSWVAGTPNTPVDFKVMVHKIHYNNAGAALPSVLAGTKYIVNGTDFSNVTFPQDVRNCTKCHDGTAGSAIQTAQGDNWKTQPSIEACGSCHDDVYFSAKPDPAKPYQTVPHPGGVADNSVCALCHAAGKYTDKKDIVVAHSFPTTFAAALAKFKYNIISATPTTAGSKPVITFSVTDPTNGDKPYNIKTDAPFTAGAASSLKVSLGWTATGSADIGNDGSGAAYGQPITIDALTASVAGATSGTYALTSPTAIAATGTLRVTIDGHPAGDVTIPGTFADVLPVTSVFQDFAITGTAKPRRVVVAAAKCDVCHGVVAMPGNERNNEPGTCVVCHNPNATDRAGRVVAGVAGEQALDFKVMIHAIHAGQADKGGFRTTGITIYGADDGAPTDFSDVVFPGKLNNCAACHTGTSYQLTGIWTPPTTNGILGTTINTISPVTTSNNYLRISPTAAVCSSCHDSAATKTHIQSNGGNFSATTATLGAAPEGCALCHGPGSFKDVQVVHGVQ